ncbi:hypothetical protein T07_9527 [Trichinella nelsoni]|uniref:Uncharacterized protein n=1 Tax=Trichinella nelsoni TaxID=6336 RepID=A0A0V0RC58_9BILA|nr:hypothetical protein T07_9527 [Trichinella nelsoni]
MRCPLQSEFEAALTAILLRAVCPSLPFYFQTKGDCNTMEKSTSDELSTVAVVS